ncbi:hypothetical protein M8J76_007246 [Diaphorina citri]|nr:hypothetical protein M8J76_007246 [Diaphorina citri]
MTSCEVCKTEDRKYKCPTCAVPYCSVKCFQFHKESNTCEAIKLSETDDINETPQPKVAPVDITEYQFPTEHTVPLGKLKLLGTNKNLKQLLANSHLRTMMTALTKTQNIHHAMNMVMLEPIFVEFAVECLRTIEDSECKEDLNSADVKEFVQQIKQLVDNTS